MTENGLFIKHDIRKTPLTTGFCIFSVAWAARFPLQKDEVMLSETLWLKKGQVPEYMTKDSYYHAHEDHELNLIERGSALYFLPEFGLIEAYQGQIALLPGNRPHHLVEMRPNALIRGFSLHPTVFRNPGMQQLEQTLVHQLAQPVNGLANKVVEDGALASALSALFAQSALEYHRQDELALATLASLGQYAALLFLRAYQLPGALRLATPLLQRLYRVKSWIDQHYLETVTLGQLAEQAELSPPYFSDSFHRMLGMPPRTYLQQCRVHHAGRLLMETAHPVLDIAFQSGFDSQSSFNRAFKQIMGCSPRFYRKKCQLHL